MRRSKSWLCYLAAVCPWGSHSPSLSLGWDSNPSLLRYVLRIKAGSVCKAPRKGLGVDGRSSQQLRALGTLGPSTPSLGPFRGLSRLEVPSALTPSPTPCLEPPWEGIRWPTGWWSTLPAPCPSPAPEPPCNLPSAAWSPNISSDFPCTFTDHKPRSVRGLCTSPSPQRKTAFSRIMEEEREVQISPGTSLP